MFVMYVFQSIEIGSLRPGRRDVKVKTRGSKGCFEGAKHIRWDHWCNDVPRVDYFCIVDPKFLCPASKRACYELQMIVKGGLPMVGGEKKN